MKDYETFTPMVVKKAKGVFIELDDGRRLIDAVSSWWCKSLGHNHPRLKQALQTQLDQFEHVMSANFCSEKLALLSSKLVALTTSLNKVMYAGDGSCAVEMALKMSVHAQQLKGQPQRTRLLALGGAYHGETCAAMGVSDLALYNAPYASLMPACEFLSPMPYVAGEDDPLWQDCSEHWKIIETQLDQQKNTLAAVIVEPILQGANQMSVYSADLLKRLRAWTKAHGVYLIADEIMTGFGRTGKMLACEHAGIEADFMCHSKGLTSGFLPLSATLTSDAIYDLFYDDYETGKAFMHSHTYTGNALAVAVALETLHIFEDENIVERAAALPSSLRSRMLQIAKSTQCLHNIRGVGAMVAADLIVDDSKARVGYQIFQEAVKLGALLRPLGNTIYWLPPLTITEDELDQLAHITQQAIMTVCL